MSDNMNTMENLVLNDADTTEAPGKSLDNGQLFLNFSQSNIGHPILQPEVVPIETDPHSTDDFYYPNATITEPQGTIIALEPVELSDENDSDDPLLGTSLDSLETFGVDTFIPIEQNSSYTLPNKTECFEGNVDNVESQENCIYNGSYVGSTGSDIPLLGASTDSENENESNGDIDFNPAIGACSTEPLINSLPPSDPHYVYQPSTQEDHAATFYAHAEPSFVSPYTSTSVASDTPLVSFETDEPNTPANKNENHIVNYIESGENTEVNHFQQFGQCPSDPVNPLGSYLDPVSGIDHMDSVVPSESDAFFQEAELYQFQQAENATCSLVNNQINDVSIVSSILVCAADDTLKDTLDSSDSNDDSDAPLLDLSPCVSVEENLDRDPVLEDAPADIPAEQFTVDIDSQSTANNTTFETVDETNTKNANTFSTQISVDSTAPLIEEKPVRKEFSALEIPAHFRVIECEPSFNMSKAAPFLHLYGSSKLLSNPHCNSREHVNLSEACIHMLNNLNNSYSNMSLMQISSLKDIRDIHLETVDTESKEERPGKHWKNLFSYSIGFMVMYMAFGSLRHLQSSLNSEAGVGLMTLSCLFAFFVIGSLFASYVVKRLEPRNATLVTVMFHLLYVISNCYPKVYILMPVSALLGFWNAVSWGASGTYIQRLACDYASKTNQKTEHVCSKFHGIFYLILFFSEVFGNLISSVILGSNAPVPILISPNNTMTPSLLVNQTILQLPENYTNQYAQCGVSFSHSDDVGTDAVPVDQTTIYILVAVFAGMDILAFFILFFCVDPLTLYYKCETTTDIKSCWQVWLDVKAVIVFMTNWRFLMLIPLYMFSAIHIAYVSAEITKAFVTCFLGIHMVGYMMICYGICDAFSSYITGWLNQITGRIALISIAVKSIIEELIHRDDKKLKAYKKICYIYPLR